ncbi:hypothetical protein C8J56DRAFT_1022255 [Mycena floridula]|nr:hypothetical protein C8J56DRAFT_1022255 [Mycena floridula]
MAQPELTGCSQCDRDIVRQRLDGGVSSPMYPLQTNIVPFLVSDKHPVRKRELVASDAQISAHQKEKTVDIPAELIGEIVFLALAAPDGSLTGVSLNVREGAWVYSQVCRVWRQEILSRTAIWSNISLHPCRGGGPDSYYLTMLREIFLRSNKQLCRLQLHLTSNWPVAKDLVAIAVQHSVWWSDVELKMDSALLAELQALQDRTPCLQRLRIRPVGCIHPPSPLLDCFRQAPALQSVLLEGPLIRSINMRVLELPWAQLHEFRHFSAIFPTALLCKLPNLVSLTVRKPREKLNPPEEIQYLREIQYLKEIEHVEEIEYKSLRTLDARDSDSTLLALFRLPSLEDLRVNARQIQAVLGLIERSSCSLKHLCIHNCNTSQFSATNFASLIRQTPDICSLDISGNVTLVVVSRIIELIAGVEYLPCLCRLILPGVLMGRCVTGLVEMVESRRLAGSPLEEIWFARVENGWKLDETIVTSNLALLDATSVKVERTSD